MGKSVPRIRASDVGGVGKLAADATRGLASVVETMHHNIARAPGPLGAAVETPMGGIPGFVYRSIRDTARMTGLGIDLLAAAISPMLAPAPSSPRREAILAALNGVLGDHLAFSINPLAIPMTLRRDGVALELTPAALGASVPQARNRVIVLVHGLCFNDLQWRRMGHDHGAALAGGPHPATVLYLHYNSGRHIATNGRELAEVLETLAGAWPVPLEEIDLIGHSMGGLVMRSAFAHAAAAGHRWLARLRTATFLGTPHAGAPLERGGHRLNVFLEESPYTIAFARLGRIRSAGIKDLRHGDLVDPLPTGVTCYAIAGSLARAPGSLRERVLGDGLVPLDSALGRKAGPGGGALFAPANQAIAYGVGHLGLLNSKKVYRTLRGWLAK